MNIPVKKASLLRHKGQCDILFIEPDWETPFPGPQYRPSLKMEIQQGYGVEYCKKVGIEPEIINVT